MSKFRLEDHPTEIAAVLIEHPDVWYVIATAPRNDNQSLRTFAYRVKAGRHKGFQKQIPDGQAGTWETTVRSEGTESQMYCRWVPEDMVESA
jgi:hypothetical protein